MQIVVNLEYMIRKLFHNEPLKQWMGKMNLKYTFTRPNIGLKRKLVFRTFEGNKDGFTNL